MKDDSSFQDREDEPSEPNDLDDLSGENSIDSASGSWVTREVRDDDAKDYMRVLSRRVTIKNQWPLEGGLSGAHTQKLLIQGGNDYGLDGLYVLKICLARDAEKEVKWHRIARDSSALGSRHIPDLAFRLPSPDGRLEGIFYFVAGRDGKATMTLHERYEENGAFSRIHLQSIANSLLEHNLRSISDPTTITTLRERSAGDSSATRKGPPPNTVIAQIGYWLEHHRLTQLDTILEQVLYDQHAWEVVLSYPLEAPPLLNPLPFVSTPAKIPQDPDSDSPFGLLHGDVHPGNLIVPRGAPSDAWYLIDFAAGRRGNAFFDLAYLEHSIMLSVLDRIGSKQILQLSQTWWNVESVLRSEMCPRHDDHFLVELILNIRRVLDEISGGGHAEVYWDAYLAASVEAALRLTRVLQFDERRRRIAFLTAASRFQMLAVRLGVRQQLREQSERCSNTQVRWHDEPPRSFPVSDLPVPAGYPLLPWPDGGWEKAELYDPEPGALLVRLCEALHHPSGIAVIGERKSGKSSYMNVVQTLLSREDNRIVFFRVPTLGFDYSAGLFAAEVWRALRQEASSLGGGLRLNSQGEIECAKRSDLPKLVTAACHAVLPDRATTTCILLLDEFDSVVKMARSASDAQLIVELVWRLAESSPLCVFLTLSEPRVIHECRPYGEALMARLDVYSVPMWPEKQLQQFIQRLELHSPLFVPLHFSDEALKRVGFYSGWQLSIAKLVVFAVQAHPQVTGNERVLVTGDMVDDAIHAVARPDEYARRFPKPATIYDAATLYAKALGKDGIWRSIYLRHFDDDEKAAAFRIAAAGGSLVVDPSSPADTTIQQGMDSLERRGYLTRTMQSIDGQRNAYAWRIGFWQLVVKDYVRSMGLGATGSWTPTPQAVSERAGGVSSTPEAKGPVANGTKARVEGRSLILKDDTVVEPDLSELEETVLRAAIRRGAPVTFSELTDLVPGSSRPDSAEIKMLFDGLKMRLRRYSAGKGVMTLDSKGLVALDIDL